jgi:aminoglycoside 6-adenylyltransferase
MVSKKVKSMNKHEKLLQKVLNYVDSDENIRVVEMNGSRVNNQIQADEYQDFDIVFYVRSFDQYIHRPDLIKQFGDVLVMQTKDDQLDENEDETDWYIYMAQYINGTRLDLTIKDLKDIDKRNDSLSKIIVNKDGLQLTSSSNESFYWVKKPNDKAFGRMVNEFYWICPYVGKGIARNHLFYAQDHLLILRNQIEKALNWWIGNQNQYQVSVGKGRHRYQSFLRKPWFDQYLLTYCRLNKQEIYDALIASIQLFDEVSEALSRDLGFEYDQTLKEQMISFVQSNYIKKES